MSSLESHPFVYAFPSIGSGPQVNSLLSREDGMQPFHSRLDLDTNPNVHLIRTAAGAFSADECGRVIEIGNSRDNNVALSRRRVASTEKLDPIKDKAW